MKPTTPRPIPVAPMASELFYPRRDPATRHRSRFSAELGMPSHAIRTYVPSQAGIGSDG